jgi:catechol 2,3-dioxygenase
MAITRFAYASMHVMDVDAAVHHYVNVVGLRLVERHDGRAYLQAMDNQDHHCLVLSPSDSAGVDHVGFKVSDPADLEEAAAAAREWGLKAERMPAGTLRGQGSGLAITLPSEHRFVLFHHADKIGYETGMRNPDPVPGSARPGLRVTHLDHTLLATERQAETVRFLEEVLDFQLTEKVVDPAGNIIAAFLSSGHTMHDVAFGPGPNGHFHHMAFGVESRGEVIEGVDLLKETDTPALEYGISRHGVAGVTTIYFHDPSGNRNEFFNGAYPVTGVRGAVPPIVWSMAEFPRGAFYYESDIPQQFFAEVT